MSKRIRFEMSGNVTSKSANRGIKYKKDFISWANRFGWYHVSINDIPDYLIYSKTGTKKYLLAQHFGIPIITYEEALDMMEDIRHKISLI